MTTRKLIPRLAIIAVALTLNGAALIGCEEAAPLKSDTRECCRYCTKGKACGDSCISRQYQCHKGTGCACNADQDD